MGETKRILVTGATGKVGRAIIDRFLADPAFDAFTVAGALSQPRFGASASAGDFEGIAGESRGCK